MDTLVWATSQARSGQYLDEVAGAPLSEADGGYDPSASDAFARSEDAQDVEGVSVGEPAVGAGADGLREE